jgi:Mrp family chromosome partitioning ATPase
MATIQPYTLNPSSSFRYTFAVVSSKGGVGKSTITSLLAVSLAKCGFRVGILDADILGPSIPGMFGINDGLYSENGLIVPYVTPLNIAIVSSQMLLKDNDEPMVYRAPIVLDLIRQLYEDTAWGERDILLIDMPPGTGDTAMTVFQQIPMHGAWMVTTPQERVRQIVAKGINMLKLVKIPLLGLIENQHHYICDVCGTSHVLYKSDHVEVYLDHYQTKHVLSLPLDSQLPFILDNGKIESFTLALVEQFVQALAKELRL